MTPKLPIIGIGTLNGRPHTPLLSFLTVTMLLLLQTRHSLAVRPRLARLRTTCTNANSVANHIAPKLADCQVVLQHLPNLPTELFHLYPVTTALKASPFLPPLNIGHGTCHFTFHFQHHTQRDRPDVERGAPQVPMELIWKVMRRGAYQIARQCEADRQYGDVLGEVELGDEGITTIAVSNFQRAEMAAADRDRVRRERERLGMRDMTTRPSKTDDDDDGDGDDGASYDLFQTPSFEV